MSKESASSDQFVLKVLPGVERNGRAASLLCEGKLFNNDKQTFCIAERFQKLAAKEDSDTVGGMTFDQVCSIASRCFHFHSIGKKVSAVGRMLETRNAW